MTTVKKHFTLDISTEEAERITDALHKEYRAAKTAYHDTTAGRSPQNYERMNALRDLRNGFAALIGRGYMGEDA